MKEYLNLIARVMHYGEDTENRTGVMTRMLPGAMMTFNLDDGFPAVTTKKLAFKSVVGELCAFLRSSRSAADFRALGCKVWDQNANENQQWLANPFREGTDDLGPVYGVQWRQWPAFKTIKVDIGDGQSLEQASQNSSLICKLKAEGWTVISYGLQGDAVTCVLSKEIDQLGDCVRTIVNNPDSRRILFHGWNPAVLDEVALPACHLLYQFMPNQRTKRLHQNVYIRSNDLGLGAPFNIAEASVLMCLIARLTGYMPGTINFMIGDAHIYHNHFDMVTEQLNRTPLPLPMLDIDERVPFNPGAEEAVAWLSRVCPEDFRLIGYDHHAAITAPMAV
jgi:thymidylate synthase